jgi:hypothetical protein
MNTEFAKTTAFILVAGALSVGAWFSIPGKPHESERQVSGSKLFPNFTQPRAVDSLKVLQYDQKGSRPLALEVAKVDNVWVIPTHGKYPADAKDHLAAAADSLIDLKILGLAPGFGPNSPTMTDAEKQAAYNRYGVVDPDPDTVKSADTGVGTRITMKDAAGHELAAAIIGKLVPEQTDQCYVREEGKEPVYVVQLDPGKLSVKFADWIEPNLLNINTMDLKQVHINDYSIERVADPETHRVFKMPVPHGEYRLDVAAGDQPWKLVEDFGVNDKLDKVPRKLAADEELNTQSLDALKTALEDLKIVDVERKPVQIPADLRVRNIDDATAETLKERGFELAIVDRKKPDAVEIVSQLGEIDLQMSDGARYILRFGNTKGASSAGDAKEKKADAADASAPGMDRYLFVMADFHQDAIAKPVMEQLPPEEKPAAKPAPKPDEKKAAGAAAAKKGPPGAPAAAEDAEKAKLRKAEQDRIEKENRRRQDEYNDKVAAGKKHVAELNKRFAQWYYVISDDVYQKIHLDRKAIVKKKEPPKDEHDHAHDHETQPGPELPVGPAGTLKKVEEPK